MNKDVTQLHNPAAEREVLSACMMDEHIYTALSHRLADDMFADEECRKVWHIIEDMAKDGKRPEFAEVGMKLMSEGGDIREFMTSGASYVITDQRIDLLTELAHKRRLYNLCNQIIAKVTNPTISTDDLQSVVSELSNTAKESEPTVLTFGEVLAALRNGAAVRMSGNGEGGLLTGLHLFDARNGFHAGDLVIIAGETSQGKSSLATTMARNMALQGIPCAFYSLEMGAEQLAARIVAQDTLIASARLLYGQLSQTEFDKFFDTTLALKELPIFFDENSKTSFNKLCTSVRAMVRLHGIRAVFIDYLQILANGDKSENREQLIGDMARALKRLAVEENVCVVALSQLSRAPMSKEPTISRLRGSGQIEEAADVVILIHRKESAAKIIIGKNRNGSLDSETVKFDEELTFFSDGDAPEPTKTKKPWEK